MYVYVCANRWIETTSRSCNHLASVLKKKVLNFKILKFIFVSIFKTLKNVLVWNISKYLKNGDKNKTFCFKIKHSFSNLFVQIYQAFPRIVEKLNVSITRYLYKKRKRKNLLWYFQHWKRRKLSLIYNAHMEYYYVISSYNYAIRFFLNVILC